MILDRVYLAWLHSLWVEQKKLEMVVDSKSYEETYKSLNYNQLKYAWLRKPTIEKILNKKESVSISRLDEVLKKRNVKLIIINDAEYPNLLKEIYEPPYLLYVRWELDNADKLSIVWSRELTQYWDFALNNFMKELAEYFVIVSWWARWIDTLAHRYALQNWWKTIAVIWTWIDLDYPTYNQRLFNQIIANSWAVVSIFPIWTWSLSHNFPIRNQIVAWLSKWTLVVEAKLKSWSLITASLTLDYSRDLYAVPWDIKRVSSQWTNHLIAKWEAKMVTSARDILEEYSIHNEVKKKTVTFSNEIDKSLYNLICSGINDVDDFLEEIDINTNELISRLSLLEVQWIIKKGNYGKYLLR